MKNLKFLLIILFPVLLFGRPVDRSDRNEMLREVSKIEDLFQRFYAPKEFKEAYEGYTIEGLFDDLRKTLIQKKNLTIAVFQEELQKTLGTLGDYHVGVQFFRAAHSSLPFSIKHIEGRYFVSEVKKECLDDTGAPLLEVGDEILAVDKVPIEEEIYALHNKTQKRAPGPTDLSIAALRFCFRDAGSGITPEKGPLEILFQRKVGGECFLHTFEWEHHKEEMPALLSPSQTLELPEMRVCDEDLFLLAETKPFNTNFHPKESVVPVPNSHFFPAYVFEHEGACFGYLKIPNYRFDAAKVQEFEETIKYLEEHTDALVIDQQGNPGGSVFYLYALASMLSETPLVVPKHQEALFFERASLYIDLRKTISSIQFDEEAILNPYLFQGYPVNQESISDHLSYFNWYLQEMEEGKKFSSFHALSGVESIKPHKTSRYTKPIVMLIDELCFSGGDFMPAIMQDNGRATIIGQRTAGAGGIIFKTKLLSPFGVSEIRLTISLAERIDGNKIESLGVEPDIYCPVTVYDVENDYQSFTSSVLQVLKEKASENRLHYRLSEFP